MHGHTRAIPSTVSVTRGQEGCGALEARRWATHQLNQKISNAGSDGQADMRASLSPSRPDRFFSFFRSDDEAALVMGTLEQPECPSEGVAWYEKSGVPRERIIRDAGGSFESIHAFLHQR
jgi:hypothetical protein